MKRFFILCLAFIVSLSVFSVLLPAQSANAASIYDQTIQSASTPFSILNSSTYQPHVSFDNSYDLGVGLATLVPNNNENAFNQCGLSNELNALWSTAVDIMSTKSKPYIIAKTELGIKVTIALTGSSNQTMYSTGINGNYVIYQQFFDPEVVSFDVYYGSNGYRACSSNSYGSNSQRMILGAYSPEFLVNVYSIIEYSGINIVYPPGYEGEVINPVNNADKVSPQIGFHVTDQNEIKALSIASPDFCIPVGLDEVTGCIQPRLTWRVFAPDHTEILDQKNTEIFTPYSFKLPGNDTYYFEISYSHPGSPFAPFNSSVELITTKFIVNANGTFVVGGTGLQDCEIVNGANECGAPDPMEDCSTYATDIGGYFQCVINNFGIWLRNALIDLFVPSYSFFKNWTDDFGDYLNSKLGFVYSSFATITTLFTGIISNGSTGTCEVNPPGELFGATVSFDVCSFQELFGNTVWNLIQGVVISLTILALCFAGYRKYLEVVDHR